MSSQEKSIMNWIIVIAEVIMAITGIIGVIPSSFQNKLTSDPSCTHRPFEPACPEEESNELTSDSCTHKPFEPACPENETD
jgi:hypothetical protein